VPDTFGLHLRNIFSDRELEEAATAEDFSVVQTEGKRQVQHVFKHYNLDASSPSAIGSNRPKAPAFASGRPACLGNTWCMATPSTKRGKGGPV